MGKEMNFFGHAVQMRCRKIAKGRRDCKTDETDLISDSAALMETVLSVVPSCHSQLLFASRTGSDALISSPAEGAVWANSRRRAAAVAMSKNRQKTSDTSSRVGRQNGPAAAAQG